MGEKDRLRELRGDEGEEKKVDVLPGEETQEDLPAVVGVETDQIQQAALEAMGTDSPPVIYSDGRSIVIGPEGGKPVEEGAPLSLREIEGLFEEGYSWRSLSEELSAASDPRATFSSMQEALSASRSFDRVKAVGTMDRLPSVEIDLGLDEEEGDKERGTGDDVPVIVGILVEEPIPRFLAKPEDLKGFQSRLDFLAKKGVKFEEPDECTKEALVEHYEFCIIWAALFVFQHAPVQLGEQVLCPFTLVLDSYLSVDREHFNQELFGVKWRQIVESLSNKA